VPSTNAWIAPVDEVNCKIWATRASAALERQGEDYVLLL
jgi:hypothetical protein